MDPICVFGLVSFFSLFFSLKFFFLVGKARERHKENI